MTPQQAVQDAALEGEKRFRDTQDDYADLKSAFIGTYVCEFVPQQKWDEASDALNKVLDAHERMVMARQKYLESL